MIEGPGDPWKQDAAGSPFAPEPRLSIRHLLIWTACVAVYMSALRSMALGRTPVTEASLQTGFIGVWGVLGGAYLAGLLLFVVRRMRRRKFPRSGGEMLWIIGGVGVVQGMAAQALFALGSTPFYWHTAFQVLFGLFVWLIYALAILRSRGYWRIFFILLVVVNVVWFFGQSFFFRFPGIRGVYLVYLCRWGVVIPPLAVVALLDFRRSDVRYPWPHWVGILLALCSNALASAYNIASLIRQGCL